MSTSTATPTSSPARSPAKQNEHAVTAISILIVVGGALLYAYWNSLFEASTAWSNGLYSHGYFVPLFTAVLLWLRQKPFAAVPVAERWAGAGLLLLGLALRMLCARYRIITVDMYSFVPSVAGLFLLAGGLRTLRWAGPPVAFLIFMFPLPNKAEQSIIWPMQGVATQASTYVFQTIGFDAFYEGNKINVDGREMNVVDQCSGLRMATIFLALAVAVTMITSRSWWEQAIIILSAIPIALAANVVRIVTTGLLQALVSDHVSHFFHEHLAAFLMMPLALGLLFFELWLLGKLVIDEDAADLMPVSVGLPRRKVVAG